MTNDTIKGAFNEQSAPLGTEVELLDSELDDVAGGACKSFTCGVFRVWEAEI